MGSFTEYDQLCPACEQHALFGDYYYRTGERIESCSVCGYRVNLSIRRDTAGNIIRRDRAICPLDKNLVIAVTDCETKEIRSEFPITSSMSKDDIYALLNVYEDNTFRRLIYKQGDRYRQVLSPCDTFRLERKEDGHMVYVQEQAIYDIDCCYPRVDGIKIMIKTMTPDDVTRLSSYGLNGPYIAEGHYLIEAEDTLGNKGEAYLERHILELVGTSFLIEHANLELSSGNAPQLKIDLAPYYNSEEHYPPRTIQVEFVTEKPGEATEVYKDIATGRYYLRMPAHNEPFARWMTCGGPNTGYIDRAEVRANITFQHGQLTETTSWSSWNGPAVYGPQYQPEFRTGGKA